MRFLLFAIFAEAKPCSQSCSAEFVDSCVPQKINSEGMSASRAYESCRAELRAGHQSLTEAGCVSDCAETAEMSSTAEATDTVPNRKLRHGDGPPPAPGGGTLCCDE